MKKLLIVLFILTVIMTLSACGSKTSSNIPDTLVDENTETNDKSTETENKNNLMINSIDATASETGPDTGKFIISRNGENTDKDLEVFYTFSGTAVLGSDYRAIPESTTEPRIVTIPKGCEIVEITITPIDDTINEEAETVIATLVPNSAYNIITKESVTVTINDNDTKTNDRSTETENKSNVTISSIDATASETGPDIGKFIISRNGENTDNNLKVFYTFSGTAVLGSDYRAIPESTTKPRVVTIPKGCKTVEITITPIDDTISEEAETVIANLVSNGAYNIIKKGSATVTINDNDYAFKEKPIVKHYWDNYESFDNALVVFSRTGSTNADLTVYYSVSGTAVKGVDYISSLSGSIVIPAGSKTAHVSFGWTHIDRSEPRYVLITLTPNSEYDISTNPVIRGTVQ